MTQRNETTGDARDDAFHTTQWSLILAATGRSAAAQAALEQLCQIYWPPLYAYVRRRLPDEHEAQDLTQEFFQRLLEKGDLEAVAPNRGRFRAFLLTALNHFLSNQWHRRTAQKRGGKQVVLSLDFSAEESVVSWEPAGGMTAEQIYERQWAITLLKRVLQRLQDEMEQKGHIAQFQAMKGALVGRGEHRYDDIAQQLGVSPAAARMAASRLRGRYRDLLREEIAQTVSTPEETEDEIRHLFQTLSR